MPVILEAPRPLAANDYELWIAAAGGADWGGCDVWVSTDDVNFQHQGRIVGPARFGELSADLPTGTAVPGTDTVNTCAVDLSSSRGSLGSESASDLAILLTLCYVGGEFIAFQTATLTAPFEYDLTTLKRGAYGSPIAALAAAGTPFVRCDGQLFKMKFLESMIGTTLYFKFPAFNKYGGALQSLGDVTSVAHTISAPVGAPPDPAVFQDTPPNPAGVADTAGRMAGLAGEITPSATGRVCVVVSGNISNSSGTPGDGAKVQIRYGTGTAPANGAALTGTAVGNLVSALGVDPHCFSCQVIISGLTLGTAYWLDLGLAAIAGGTALADSLSVTAFEL